MENAYLLSANGDIREITPENGTDFKLAELYAAIGCDTVEVIDLQFGKMKPSDPIMIGDEEARFGDPTVNQMASKIYQEAIYGTQLGRDLLCKYLARTKYENDPTLTLDPDDCNYIVGNIVICPSKMFR